MNRLAARSPGTPRKAEFTHRRSRRASLVHDPHLPESLIEELWSDADSLLSGGEMLKDGDRCTVVKLAREGRSLALKRYNLKGRFHTLVHMAMRSRAQWCWRNGHMLMRGGVLTPTPLAALTELQAGLLRRRSYLLCEFIPGQPLRDWVNCHAADQQLLRAIADQFCALWRDLATLRLGHGDMKATNFLVDDQQRLWLIDLDGMRTYRTGPVLRAERRKDLARFMRNWKDLPDVAAIFRARIGTG